MPNYRRNVVPGGTYFFTVVTHERRPLFDNDANRNLLGEAMRNVQSDWPFTAFASVLLPDHFHCVWILPDGDEKYSVRLSRIKQDFTKRFIRSGGREGFRSRNRVKHRERGVWQPRYWEHTVRNADDLIRCVDYIHWNPVKHGYVNRPGDWKWSSFARFVESGDYPPNWGDTDPCVDIEGAEWD